MVDFEVMLCVTEYRAQVLVDAQGKCYVAPFPTHAKRPIQDGMLFDGKLLEDCIRRWDTNLANQFEKQYRDLFKNVASLRCPNPLDHVNPSSLVSSINVTVESHETIIGVLR
ncbi:MAG: hypothetical protein GKR77_04515 [Legionellales bacterium]|nr:hypothetical protein [Legionellales bacterium]